MTDSVVQTLKKSLPDQFFKVDESIEITNPVAALRHYFPTIIDLAAIIYQITIQNYPKDQPLEIVFAKYFPTFSRIVYLIDFYIDPKTSRDIDFEEFALLFYQFVDLSVAFDLFTVYSKEHVDKFIETLKKLEGV